MENNEITTITTNPVADFSATNNSFFCSMSVENDSDRATLYNALSNPDVKIADHLNQEIVIKDIIIEPVEVVADDGTRNTVPRTVIIDIEGNTFAAVSTGIYNALKRIVSIYGMPTYANGVRVKVIQIARGANRIYSLVVV